jgi:hypothetical protein
VAGCGGDEYKLELLYEFPLPEFEPEFDPDPEPEFPLPPVDAVPEEPLAECGPKYAVPCQYVLGWGKSPQKPFEA